MPCDLDLGAARGPRGGRGALRRAGRRAARRARRRRHGARGLARAARGPGRRRASTSTAGSCSTSACPPHRLLPAALVAPEKQILVTAVCGARPLAEGRPPMGIVCAQQDVARVYPLPDDPERCLEDFLELAAEHARRVGEQLRHQEASVQRFLELSGATTSTRPASAGRGRAARGRLAAAVTVLTAAVCRRLRVPRHLVPARPRTDRRRGPSARGCSTSCAPRPRGDAAAVLAQLPACAAEPACARADPRPASRARTPRQGRDPQLRAVGAGDDDAPPRHRPRGLARRHGRSRSSSAQGPPEGPLTGGGVELLAISQPIAGQASCG